MSFRSKLVALGGFVLLGLADALLKVLALTYAPGEQEALLDPIFDTAVHRNQGIAFNLPVPLTVVVPLTVIACLFLLRIAKNAWSVKPQVALAASLVIVGAVGNLVDRLINGFVVDYLIFFRTSAINLSDVYIVLGLVALLWYDSRIPRSRP